MQRNQVLIVFLAVVVLTLSLALSGAATEHNCPCPEDAETCLPWCPLRPCDHDEPADSPGSGTGISLFPLVSPTGPTGNAVTGKTDSEGDFEIALKPGYVVSGNLGVLGRLEVGHGEPLRNQDFTITAHEDGFRVQVPGFEERYVEPVFTMSFFGTTTQELGHFIVEPPPAESIPSPRQEPAVLVGPPQGIKLPDAPPDDKKDEGDVGAGEEDIIIPLPAFKPEPPPLIAVAFITDHHNLTWDDFPATASEGASMPARIETTLSFKSGSVEVTDHGIGKTAAYKNVTMSLEVDTSKSWVRGEADKNEKTLTHMQGVWDISKVYAWKIEHAYAQTRSDGELTEEEARSSLELYTGLKTGSILDELKLVVRWYHIYTGYGTEHHNLERESEFRKFYIDQWMVDPTKAGPPAPSGITD